MNTRYKAYVQNTQPFIPGETRGELILTGKQR
jgi:hypothetical protein